jgi:hypothetical protein
VALRGFIAQRPLERRVGGAVMIRGLLSRLSRPLPSTRLDELLGVSQGWGLTLAVVALGVLWQIACLALLLAVQHGWRPWFVLMLL